MGLYVADPRIEHQLIEQRRAIGADRHDEMWEGVYMMAPVPNDEHQDLVANLTGILFLVVRETGLGVVRPGVNLTDRSDDWEQNYRCPDVIVLRNDTKAENFESYWRGPADFLIEIISPGDRTREKMAFYSKVGVRELLVVDRDPWQLELYRHEGEQLRPVGVSRLPESTWLKCDRVPLRMRLVEGEKRPLIEVEQHGGDGRWTL